MKYIIVILTLVTATLFGTSPKKERLDIILSKGMNEFENKVCLKNDGSGAIRYFEDYINLGGEKDKVLKYLAYCKIEVGQAKKGETESLKEGVKLLSEVFEKDNQNLEILKLLLSLYIQLEDFEKAKTYAILINEEKNVDNDLYMLISRLYFNTKEYHKVINYAKKYQINKDNQSFKIEKYFLLAFSYFKLNDNKNSKIYFDKLLKENKLSNELKEISLNALKIIDKNENFGKYSSWYNITLTNGLVFDSNIISQPPFSYQYNSDLPGTPSSDDTSSEITAIGARDENYISLYFYPLNLNKHSIILNLNNFIALHYPKSIDEVFDPQVYDTIGASVFAGYEYHNYFTQKNVFKMLFMAGYNYNWTNPINDFDFYSKAIRFSFNTFYRFPNAIELGMYSSLSFETYNTSTDEEKEKLSQDGKYFDSIISASLPITESFIIQLASGYTGSKTTGSLFTYNGFLGSAKLSFKFFDFLEVTSDIKFEQKKYIENTRSDRLIRLGGNIIFDVKDYFNIDLSYHFNRNDSTLNEFDYNKHLISLYFNFIM